MANNAIGTGAIILSANADRVPSGLARAEATTRSWAGGLASRVAMAVPAGGILGSILGGGALGSFLGPKGMLIGSAIGGIASSARGAANSFSNLSEKADAAGKAASAVGMRTETYMGLQHAAELSGVSVEELGGALNRFRLKAEGPLDTALGRLADRVAGTADPMLRAQMAVDAFGKSGGKLLPMLEGGSAGLKNMIDDAKRLGKAISDEDHAKLAAANDAITRAAGAVRGVFLRVAVAVSPLIENIATGFGKVFDKFQPAIDWAMRALTTIGEIGGLALGALSDAAVMLVDDLGGMAKATIGFTEQWPTVAEVVKGAFRSIGVSGAYAFDAIAAGVGGLAVGIGHLIEHGLGPLAEGLVKIGVLSEGLGISGQKIREWGSARIDNFGQSAEKVRAFFDNLKPIEVKPRIGGAAIEDNRLQPMKFAPAMLAASAEAYSLAIRNKFPPEAFKPPEKKQELDALRNINRNLERIDRKLEGLPELEIGVV